MVGIGNDKIISYNKELEVRPYRRGELFFDDMHVTETAHGLVAEGVLETLKENDFFRDRLREKQPSYQDSKGNYHLSENCNAFTLGHRYLIETCSKKCDMLIVFVVQEDKSYFPYEDRIRLVREGAAI